MGYMYLDQTPESNIAQVNWKTEQHLKANLKFTQIILNNKKKLPPFSWKNTYIVNKDIK